jgi:hypothetical protein
MRTFIQKTYTSVADNLKLAARYSVILAFSFIVIYVLARITGLYKITELRFINYILFYPVGYMAVRKAFKFNNGYLEYFSGLMIGFLTGMLGQLWFALLFFIYLHVDASFLDYLVNKMPQPLLYPRLSILFVMLAEGVGMSAILSLTLMQIFKWRQGRWAVSHG